MPGFATYRLPDLRVPIGQTVTHAVVMSAEITERIQVLGRAAIVDLDKTGRGGMVVYSKSMPLRGIVEHPDSYYFANSELLFRDHPDLITDMGIDRLREYMPSYTHWNQQFFVSTGRKAVSGFHNGFVANLFFNIQGRKRWRIVHPYFTFMFHAWILNFEGNCAALDLGAERREMFPLLNYVPYYEVTLEPGDMLWIPYYWWHSVESLSDENLAISSRWKARLAVDCHDPGAIFTKAQGLNPNRLPILAKANYWERRHPGEEFPFYDHASHGRTGDEG